MLKAYLEEREKEVASIMMALFDEEYIRKAYGNERYNEGIAKGMAKGRAEGKAEGRAEGKAEGMLEMLINLVRDGVLNLKDASSRAHMSESEFSALVTRG